MSLIRSRARERKRKDSQLVPPRSSNPTSHDNDESDPAKSRVSEILNEERYGIRTSDLAMDACSEGRMSSVAAKREEEKERS